MTAVATELDLELLFDEDIELSCEHHHHDKDKRCHDNGPAKFYIRVHHDDCGRTRVYPGCEKWAMFITRHPDCPAVCRTCQVGSTLGEMATVLGPVNGCA